MYGLHQYSVHTVSGNGTHTVLDVHVHVPVVTVPDYSSHLAGYSCTCTVDVHVHECTITGYCYTVSIFYL